MLAPCSLANTCHRHSALPCRCVSILLITSGSSMPGMTLMMPPQTRHVSMSILNTHFKRCAQLIAARRSTGIASSAPAALVLLAPPRRASAVLTAGCEHAVIARQVYTRFGHQRRQPRFLADGTPCLARSVTCAVPKPRIWQCICIGIPACVVHQPGRQRRRGDWTRLPGPRYHCTSHRCQPVVVFSA